MLMSHGRLSLIILWLCLFDFATKAVSTQSSLINFGAPLEDSKQAAYYMTADSGFPDTHPADEVKRTQRSFWKKLFKHGLFGEDDDCDNCCNPNYDAGDGNNYNAPTNDAAFPVFQPFRNIQPWRPFQPLFRSTCQRCSYPENNSNYANSQGPAPYNNNYGSGSYEATPNPAVGKTYDGGVGSDNSYITKEGQDNNPYETPTVSYTPSVSEAAPPDVPANVNSNNAYSQPSNAYGDTNSPSYDNKKLPQILYQPIIYVSPQLPGYAVIKPNTKNETYVTQSNGPDGTYQTYQKDQQAPKPTSLYESPTKCTTEPISQPISTYSTSPILKPPVAAPCHEHSTPTVSTVSTIYTVITPPKGMQGSVCSNDYGQHHYKPTNQMDTGNTGPSKYSLFPVAQSYAGNMPPSLPAVVPSKPTCLTPLQMTLDDQPYRVCPELFDEYNRRVNKIVPCANYHQGEIPPLGTGNTYVNAQFIN